MAGQRHYIAWRIVQSVPVLIGVTLAVFLLIHLVPGDPARTALGTKASPAAIERLHDEWNLDRSLPEQYADFVSRLARGDLGTSTVYDQPVRELVADRIGVTVWLLIYSTLLVCVIAVPLAIFASVSPGAAVDGMVRLVSVAGLGIPAFWLGLLFIQHLAIGTGLFPAAGFGESLVDHLWSMFLPSLTVAIVTAPLVIRSLRAEMIKVTDSDYVVTARSKGLPEWRIRIRHILRNALVPAVAVLAINVGFLVGGTLVVEQVFSLPGLGSLMVDAISRRDFTLVQSLTLVFAVMVIVVNLLADVVHARLDPRVRA